MKSRGSDVIDMNKGRFSRAQRAIRKRGGNLSAEESSLALRDMLISIGNRLHETRKERGK